MTSFLTIHVAEVKVPSSGQVEFRILRNGNEDEATSVMHPASFGGESLLQLQQVIHPDMDKCSQKLTPIHVPLRQLEGADSVPMCSFVFNTCMHQGPSKDDQRNAKNTWLAEGIPAETPYRMYLV